jgi:uncharacterized protein
MPLPKKVKLGKRARQRFYRSILIVFIFFNILTFIAAYTLTHFSVPGQFSWGLPKQYSSKLPSDLGLEYITDRISISSTEWLETWVIPASNSNGTVILFPGNAGSKAQQLIAPAQVFHSLGYDTLLVDFRGSGGSSGNTTTLGMREAEDVALSVSYAKKIHLKRPVILYGVSMGSAAIIRAVATGKVTPDGIILELPFARLTEAVNSRLRAMSVPTFPLAESLVFWGGIQFGFNGFAHNPVDYASQVKCPTLVLHGKLDKWTTVAEIDRIYQNLGGTKQLSIFPNAGHDLLVTADRKQWQRDIEIFLKKVAN